MSAIRKVLEALRDKSHATVTDMREIAVQVDEVASSLRRALDETQAEEGRTSQWKFSESQRLRQAARDVVKTHMAKVERLGKVALELADEADLRKAARGARFIAEVRDWEKKPDATTELLQEIRRGRARDEARDLRDDQIPREIEHATSEGTVDERLAVLHVLAREVERRDLKELPGVRARKALDDAFAKVAGELPMLATARKHLDEVARLVEHIELLADEVNIGSESQRLRYLRATQPAISEVQTPGAAAAD